MSVLESELRQGVRSDEAAVEPLPSESDSELDSSEDDVDEDGEERDAVSLPTPEQRSANGYWQRDSSAKRCMNSSCAVEPRDRGAAPLAGGGGGGASHTRTLLPPPSPKATKSPRMPLLLVSHSAYAHWQRPSSHLMLRCCLRRRADTRRSSRRTWRALERAATTAVDAARVPPPRACPAAQPTMRDGR